MATANIKIAGATYESVPSVTLKDTNNANVNFVLTSDATAAAANIEDGYSGYVNGTKVEGTMIINKYYTGTSTPASSLGNDGDIYFKYVPR